MKIFTSATKIFGLTLSLFFVNSVFSQSIYTLPVGTQIDARMDSEVNSKVFSVNDTFTATVSKPLIIREVLLLPTGTILEGRIIKIKGAGFGKKSGSIEIQFETLRLPNGAKRQIDGRLAETKQPQTSQLSKPALIGGGTIIGALFGAIFDKGRGALIGAGTGLGIGTSVILLQKGKEARIEEDEQIKIVLKREVTLPAEDF